MTANSPKSNRSDVIKLIAVLFSGVAAAFLVAVFFVMNYGPSGRYAINTVLLDPDILLQLNYNDYNAKTGGNDRFVFDSLTVEYQDKTSKKLEKKTIDVSRYSQLFVFLNGEKSIVAPEESVAGLFRSGQPLDLIINVRTESPSAWQAETKVFQEVQFSAQGDYFRVELHEDGKKGTYAYFHKPHVTEDALKILTQ